MRDFFPLDVESLFLRNTAALGMAASAKTDSQTHALTAVAPRERLLFDFGWKFSVIVTFP